MRTLTIALVLSSIFATSGSSQESSSMKEDERSPVARQALSAFLSQREVRERFVREQALLYPEDQQNRDRHAELERIEIPAFEVRDVSVKEAAEWLTSLTGVPIRVVGRLSEDRLSLMLQNPSGLDDLLELLCLRTGGEWTIGSDGVELGSQEFAAAELVTRFHYSGSVCFPFGRVPPDFSADPTVHWPEDYIQIEELVNLIRENIARESWDVGNAVIDTFDRDTLLVVHEPDVHAEIERMLSGLEHDLFANPDSVSFDLKTRPEVATKSMLARLEDTEVTFPAEPILEDLPEYLKALSAQSGIDVLLGDDHQDEAPLHRMTPLSGSHPLTAHLESIRDRTGMGYDVVGGAILVTGDATVPLLTRFYRAPEAWNPPSTTDDEERRNQWEIDWLADIVRNTIDVESWDLDPNFTIQPMADHLVVRQSATAHAEIERLLQQLHNLARIQHEVHKNRNR